MLQLYLLQLLQLGKSDKEKPRGASTGGLDDNRRTATRYDVKEEHLTLRNKEDIFSIKNVSKNGFSVEVPKRSFDRLIQGDIYLCKLRHLKEYFSCNAYVRWKKDNVVGFELSADSNKVRNLFSKLMVQTKNKKK